VKATSALRSLGLIAVIAALLLAVGAGVPLPARADASIDEATTSALASAAPTDMLDVLVVLRHQARLPAGPSASRSARRTAVIRALRSAADVYQAPLVALLARRKRQGLVDTARPFWILNGLQVVAVPSVIYELAALPAVQEIRANATIQAPAAPAGATAPTEPNVALVNAPALWERGYDGHGIVVASMDTGVDATHPDLAARWRGGSNSWYDPNGQHPTTPTDVSGHGTWTTGVMVGGDAGGTTVGVAPGAQWIAAKIFDDRGVATTARIHAAFQWLLDPDGNPSSDDAPNVVDESWNMSGSGCQLEFQLDLHALRAAAILPVFAAGNRGPNAATSVSPGNNPDAFAVGGTDLGDAIDPSSSRGPSACGQTIYPSLTAPGVTIHTTDLYGYYTTQTGTSLAAPHVTGGLALLLSALPNLSAEQQESALRSGAVDLGASGADNVFGSGRLDLLNALNWATVAPDFTVSATPGSAATAAGGSVSYDVTVGNMNGFNSDVALSVLGLPAGKATATFAPPTIPGASGTATLTVATTTNLAPGTYPLTITGASGGMTRTTAVTLVVVQPPDFALSATPSSASTPPGGSASYTVTTASQGGFAGDIALSVSGLPAPASATFSPASIAGGAGSSQLTVATTAPVSPGSYPLTITGTSGQTTHTAAVTLVVSPPPDFTLSATPSSASAAPGGSASYTVTVASQNGFAGAVALSVSGLPAQASATFAPTSIAGGAGSSQLKVTTTASVSPGSYPLTITGTSGQTTHTAAVILVVAATPDFSLAVSPTSATVTAGQSTSFTITVSAQGGFTGSVALSVAGLPSGASGSFSRNPVTGAGTSTLTVATARFTTRGTFTVRITGRSGSITRQVTTALTVRS
jgi:subtilisin family serine protease